MRHAEVKAVVMKEGGFYGSRSSVSRRDTERMPLRRAVAASDVWLLRDDSQSCDNGQEELLLVYGGCVFVYHELQGGIWWKVNRRSFPVIYDLSKKSYKDKIAKDNAWKGIATPLERDSKFSV